MNDAATILAFTHVILAARVKPAIASVDLQAERRRLHAASLSSEAPSEAQEFSEKKEIGPGWEVKPGPTWRLVPGVRAPSNRPRAAPSSIEAFVERHFGSDRQLTSRLA
jgi:hypothetical protein